MDNVSFPAEPPTPRRSSILSGWRSRRLALGAGVALVVLLLGAVALVIQPAAGTLALQGELRVESQPTGATVTVDGEGRGSAPLTLIATDGAVSYHLVLTLNGYRPLEQTVSVLPGQREQVTLAMTLLPAKLALESTPPGAAIEVDGQERGRTPIEMTELPPGLHSVALKLSGYAPWSSTMTLQPGGSEQRTVRMEPLPASLEILTNVPGAAVALGGAARGTAPLSLAGLAPGRYELRLEKEGFKPWQSELSLDPGEAKRVQADLANVEMTETTPAEPEQAVAVIVENMVDARPQAGLDRADVVYEALAEGGITRFLALYLTSDAPLIGPIRSARHYYVQWAREYDAALVHIGASPQGFQALWATGLRNLDESRGGAIWRSRERLAPHNAYSSTEAIRSGLGSRAAGGSWGGLLFKAPEWRYPGEPVGELNIDYGWNYRVSYAYDPDNNQYLRTMAGSAHSDAESGEQIRASSVVVMTVGSWPMDNEGRLDMGLTGRGKALYFLDGVHVEGTWQRERLDQPTVFLDADGKVMHLNSGPLWIQVVPPGARVDY